MVDTSQAQVLMFLAIVILLVVGRHRFHGNLEMINLRGALVVVMATGLFTFAAAHAEKRMSQEAFCKMVRQAAKTYGADTIESMARASGASEADIQSAKRCLK